MADRNELLSWPSADGRRRIHIRTIAGGATYALGATGRPHMADSEGEALEQALAGIGHEPAVIIYEGGR